MKERFLTWGSVDGTDSLTISGENTPRTTAMISCEDATLNMYSGVTIRDADNNGGASGSGVFVYGTFNMYGGTITGCDGSTIGFGGAVALHKGTFNMYGGTLINNTVTGYGYGGGVFIYSDRGYECTFNMYGGSIVENYAYSYGGGVCLYEYNAPAYFNMYGGMIEENKTSGNGGGVYFNNNRFHIAPQQGCIATIQQNQKTTSIETETETENNVFVYTGQTIEIGELKAGCKIGITEQASRDDIPFTLGYAQNNIGVHPSYYFVSDDSAYLTDYIQTDTQEVRLAKGSAITFKIENGTWSDGTTNDKTAFVYYTAGTLQGSLLESDIPSGMIPFKGYGKNGKWNPELNTAVTEAIIYTYRFPAQTYSVIYTDGVDGQEVFADQITTDILSGANTPVFNGTPTRDGYVFAGWTPEVTEKVTADATYTATWTENKNENSSSHPDYRPPAGWTNPDESGESSDSSDIFNPGNGDTDENPQTGDSSNTHLWGALLILSGSIVIGTAVYNRKKMPNR